MTWRTSILPWVLCAGAVLPGCSAEWPFQRKPSQAVRQAQALVEDDIAAARPHADATGQAHLVEAAGAAKAVSEYVGPPRARLQPAQPVNQDTIARALADARKAEPTMQEVLREVPDEVERTAGPWMDLAAAVLLGFGATGAGAAVLKFRGRAKTAMEAFRETVAGIENGKRELPAPQREILSAELAKAQSAPAKAIVTELKTSLTG